MINISKKDNKIIRRLMKLLKPFKKQIMVIIGFMIISSCIGTLLPLLSKQLMDKGLIAKNFEVIFIICILTLGLQLAEQVLDSFRDFYQNKISSLLSFTLTKTAFKHSLKLKSQYFNNTNITELMNNINFDVSNISIIADQSMFYILMQLFRIIGGLVGLILFVDVRLAILSLAEIPARYFIIKYLTKKRKKSFENYIEDIQEYAGWYGDTLGGIKEIKLWGIERIKIGQFIKKQRKMMKAKFLMDRIDITNDISEGVLTHIMTCIVYLVGGVLITHNSITIGSLFAFFTYSIYVTGPISSVLNIGYHFTSIIPSAKRFFEFLDMETEGQATFNKNLKSEKVLGDIKFDEVSFSYLKGQEILKDISFEIGQGEKVAIVGENGAGKSSIINLLLQLNQPDKGQILLDNIDIKEYKIKDYRKLFSVVSQSIYLFDSSIRHNISLGLSIGEDKVYKASKESGAHRFINGLTDKYDTQVGSNGSNLSGGERQKIAIARSLVRDSKILILDEANSNCDVNSEIEFTRIIKESHKEKTIIVITHKTNILRLVDKVIVIGDGDIQNIGTHEELYNSNKLYKKMINSHEMSKEII